jgi:hypothetical protein
MFYVFEAWQSEQDCELSEQHKFERGATPPRSRPCSTIPRRCKSMSFASRNDRVGQLWGGDLQRRKPILGVMSSRMGPGCRKGSRFSGAANNANWFPAPAVWPSRTKALAQLLYFWGNKGYTTGFFISGSNCFFPFEKSRVSGVHSSEPFSQISDF